MPLVLLPLEGYTARINASVLFQSGHNLHRYPALSGFSTLPSLQDWVLPLQINSVSDSWTCSLRGIANQIIFLTSEKSSECYELGSLPHLQVHTPKTSQATLEMTIISLFHSPGLDSYTACVTSEDNVLYFWVTGSSFFCYKKGEQKCFLGRADKKGDIWTSTSAVHGKLSYVPTSNIK